MWWRLWQKWQPKHLPRMRTLPGTHAQTARALRDDARTQTLSGGGQRCGRFFLGLILLFVKPAAVESALVDQSSSAFYDARRSQLFMSSERRDDGRPDLFVMHGKRQRNSLALHTTMPMKSCKASCRELRVVCLASSVDAKEIYIFPC